MNRPTKHIICLWAVLFAGVLASGLLAAESPNSLELDGREVVVRVYKNWQDDPCGFYEYAVRLKGRIVRFDFNDVNESAFVAVVGHDQEDDVAREAIANRICGWGYERRLQFSLPGRPPKEQDFWWSFADALGNPIPSAVVRVYLTDKEHHVLIGRWKADADGRLRLPFCLGTSIAEVRIGHGSRVSTSQLRFIVSSPEYGTGVVESSRFKKPYTIFAPVVRPSTEAYERCAWGVVVDSDNNRVSGVLVRCTGLVALGGNYINGIYNHKFAAPTDEDGRFRLYLPVAEDQEGIGTLIPPKTEYCVKIDPPTRLGLLPYSGKIPNGQETKITLETAGYSRTFAFEDENGPITDSNQLRRIEITIQRSGKPNLWLNYEKWRDGGFFPVGRYEARCWAGRGYGFEPIEVAADSPKWLVFKLLRGRPYYGQVVDGITGEPMEGAFVIDVDGSCSQENLSMLANKQWDALHDLPASTSGGSGDSRDVLRPVTNSYSFSMIARTKKDGWFEMTLPPKRDFSKIVIFDANRLTVITDRRECESEGDNSYKVPLTKLFPAATVVVEACADDPNDPNPPTIWPEWIIDEKNNPPWVRDLLANCQFDNFMDGIRKDFSVHLNKQCSFYVPAELNLQLQLRPRYDESQQWSPLTIAESVNLQQGQRLDLGRWKIQRTIKVFVEILDSTGGPVEGVPVTAISQYGDTSCNTDEYGLAPFDVAPDAKGEFVVEHKPADSSDEPHLREALPYEITSPEDANTVFTLRVSDEIFYHLFK